MKKVLAAVVIVFSLTACSSGNNSDTTSDTSTTTISDTSGILPVDTASINTGDSTGINRDTARADRTRLKKNVDTARRIDSSSR